MPQKCFIRGLQTVSGLYLIRRPATEPSPRIKRASTGSMQSIDYCYISHIYVGNKLMWRHHASTQWPCAKSVSRQHKTVCMLCKHRLSTLGCGRHRPVKCPRQTPNQQTCPCKSGACLPSCLESRWRWGPCRHRCPTNWRRPENAHKHVTPPPLEIWLHSWRVMCRSYYYH